MLSVLRAALPVELRDAPADPAVVEDSLEPSPQLVLVHVDAPGIARDLVAGIRRALPGRAAPLICVLPREDAEPLVRGLVNEYGVERVLFQPADPQEIAGIIATRLGVPVHAPTAAPEPDRDQVASVVARLWEQMRPTVIERLDLLDNASVEALAGSLTADLREQAEREAHRLAGSLGTYGFPEGTRLAREFEMIVVRGVEHARNQALELADLANRLRGELEAQGAGSLAGPDEVDGRPLMLIAEQDEDIAKRLATAAEARGYRASVATSIAGATTMLAGAAPALVLLDLNTGDDTRPAIPLIDRLTSAVPPTPVVVLTDDDGFTDRVAVARAGGTGILPRSLSAEAVMDAALTLGGERGAERPGILAVDDDPGILAALKSVLTASGYDVTTLDDPLRFWDALRSSQPDLVMLDLDMPHVGGIELCRVVRGDPRWAGLPILFLTAHDDPDSIRRVFAAGADDYIRKPLVGAEIVARIANRLERVSTRRRLAQMDPASGALDREAAEAEIDRLLALGRRYSQSVTIALLSPDATSEATAAGDAVDEPLRRLVQVLVGTLRPEDVIGRWSARNLIVAMFGLTRADGVQHLAEGLEAFRALGGTEPGAPEIGGAFSAGVASLPGDGDGLEVLSAAAQNALMAAVAGGGDRVVPAGWNADADPTLLDVAVVEDDPVVAELLVHTLGTRALTTRVFADGLEARRSLLGPPPEVAARLVLLDVNLPGLDGLTLLRDLRAAGILEATRVIMLTGRSAQAEVVQALELGAFDHVAKPFSVRVLMERIRRALEG